MPFAKRIFYSGTNNDLGFVNRRSAKSVDFFFSSGIISTKRYKNLPGNALLNSI
jgi:hypothetical protein